MLTAADEECVRSWANDEIEARASGLLGLYRVVARARGCEPSELDKTLRHDLASAAMPLLWPNFEQVAPARVDGIIALEEHQTEWAGAAASYIARLRVHLPACLIAHIGSTAISGLPAKGIIDLLIAVDDVRDEKTYRHACEELGVVLSTRDDEHRFFCAPEPEPRVLHIHVCNRGGHFEREHLLFRDYLRSHSDDARRYAESKLLAAQSWSDDRFGYTDAKTVIIGDINARAEAWARSTGWVIPVA